MTDPDDRLDSYRRKRNSGKSREPAGDSRTAEAGGRRFVIQKHDARRLHYDLRLEVDGVLKSWAVPKGPSTDPSDKRMAIMTEDHPLDYADFEGVIPKDEYGGGTVLIWDRGDYDNLRAEKQKPVSMAASLEDGKVEFRLHGAKLSGAYVLTRIEGGNEEKSKWLLIKMRDDAADARRKPTETEPDSVVTGRDLDEVAEEERGE
jgi:DNA ligase D-like protein (predicted 3'-phosphoesterase)